MIDITESAKNKIKDILYDEGNPKQNQTKPNTTKPRPPTHHATRFATSYPHIPPNAATSVRPLARGYQHVTTGASEEGGLSGSHDDVRATAGCGDT